MIKRKDGLLQESLTINGKRKYFYGHTKAEVLRKIQQYKEKEQRGKLFEEVALEWSEEHQYNIRPSSYISYVAPLKTLITAFGDMPIKDITAHDIDRYMQDMGARGYAKNTVRCHLSVMSLIFTYGIKNGYNLYNPTTASTVPRQLKTTERQLPSVEMIDKIKSSLNLPFGLFAYFLLYTGCRRGEALAVTMQDLDFENKTIRINKSVSWIRSETIINEAKTKAGNRTIILLDTLADKLPHKKQGYLFGNKAPLSHAEYIKLWREYINATGLDITPHQLRHLYATILYEADIDEKIVQELMGHSSISVTKNVYTHIRNQRMKEVAELLNNKLDV